MIEFKRDGSFIIPENEKFIGYAIDNRGFTQSFFIDSIIDLSLSFKLILRFENGTENYFILERKQIFCGTVLDWSLSADKFSYSGLAQIQIRGTNSSGIVFESDFINIHIDSTIKFITNPEDIDAIYSLVS